MYKEVIVPKAAKHSIDIPKEYINKKVTVVLEPDEMVEKAERKRVSKQSVKKIKFHISPTVRKGAGITKTESRKANRKNPRRGWAKLFKQMHENGDDKILIPDAINIDSKDWEW